jgi:parallel beta-helix repeat protein
MRFVKILGIVLGALAGCAPPAQVIDNTFNVKNFGAVGNGKAFDTRAVNLAIERAASVGGGTVYFPAGTYLCFSIHLKSNITIHLEQGATILAAEAPADEKAEGYDAPEPCSWDRYQDFGHSHWHNSLIWGEDLQNVSIFGPGTIDGLGLSRGAPTPKRNPSILTHPKIPTTKPKFFNGSDDLPDNVGNKAIALKNCRNVIFRDFTIYRGGHFGILCTGVDNWTCDNLKIDTNRDGIDLDSCQNVRVSNCTVNSPFDDGICLKSSYALSSIRATQNVTITNCQVSGYDLGTLLDGTYIRSIEDNPAPMGRIKLGTESNGGFKNITISNCNFEYCKGLALESEDGGELEDVTINNITMRDLVSSPIFLRLGARLRGPDNPPVGQLRRVIISNIVCYNADPRFASTLSGVPGHDIEDIRLENINIYERGGGDPEWASADPPEQEAAYPDPHMFGPLPAYGFFIRHVNGLQMHGVNLHYLGEENRSPFVIVDSKNIDLHEIVAPHEPSVAIFQLKNVEGFNVEQSTGIADTRRDKVDQEKF